MELNRFSPSLFAILLLAGCTATPTPQAVTYDLSFDVTDSGQVANLTQAAMNVVTRRLDAMGVLQANTQIGADNTSITTTLPDKEGTDELTRQLTSPFSMAVMRQAEAGETPDVTVEGHGSFVNTDVSTEDFMGVEVGRDDAGAVRARLQMTDAGRAKMDAIFKTQAGKNIGIFVRDRIVSKLSVAADATSEDLQIRNIPSILVAEAFADDVNVGLHVVYTPRP